MPTARHSGVFALVLMLSACSSAPTIPVAERVDLERFMGDWYVIANIPTSPENATTFTFREGSFDGPEKVMRPRGFVRDQESNAVWGMQFVWPIKAEYLIAHVDEDYSETIIARSRLDYVWVMARTPQIPAEDFERLRRQVADLGYDVNKLQKVPQRW